MSEQLTGGMAGLQFVKDIIFLLENSWLSDNGGDKPQVVKVWELKQVGLADNKYSVVIVNIDSENPQIYSMLQGNGGDPLASNYDWLHEVSITLDVRTSISEDRVLEMVNETMRIIKTNIVPTINNNFYVQLLPEGLTSMNEEYRGLYRYIMSVSVLKFNP